MDSSIWKEREHLKRCWFGSVYGYELEPIIDRIEDITILDPSDSFVQKSIRG